MTILHDHSMIVYHYYCNAMQYSLWIMNIQYSFRAEKVWTPPSIAATAAGIHRLRCFGWGLGWLLMPNDPKWELQRSQIYLTSLGFCSWVHARLGVYNYVYIYIYICVYTCIYIYTYTYICNIAQRVVCRQLRGLLRQLRIGYWQAAVVGRQWMLWSRARCM